MTDTSLPEWAMKWAHKIDCNLSSEKTRHDFARALVATDKAAREEERERCAKIATSRVPLWDEARAIAAAIRKGD